MALLESDSAMDFELTPECRYDSMKVDRRNC